MKSRSREQILPDKREVLVVAALFIALAMIYRYAWIPTEWEVGLQAASDTLNLPFTTAGRWFSAWAIGDGQAFAAIAADPVGFREGAYLDDPVYRYSRAGFGWLAGVASLAHVEWIPQGLAVVSSLTLIGIFLITLRLRPILGASAWFILLNPAVFIAFAGDTAESLGVLALTWTMATGKWWAAAALGVIRPSFIVALWGRWRLFLASAVTAAAFGAIWITQFGSPLGLSSQILGPPVVGYLADPSPLGVFLASLAAVSIGMGIKHRNWAWAVSGLFILCLTETVVGEAVHGWRAAGMLFVLWAFGPDYSGPVLPRVSSRESLLEAV